MWGMRSPHSTVAVRRAPMASAALHPELMCLHISWVSLSLVWAVRLNNHGITNQAFVTGYFKTIGNATGPVLHVIVGTIHTATVVLKLSYDHWVSTSLHPSIVKRQEIVKRFTWVKESKNLHLSWNSENLWLVVLLGIKESMIPDLHIWLNPER